MSVKIQRPIKFNNACGCLVDEKLLAKAMLWYANKPQCSIKNIYMHGKYPAISIHKEKIHVHRLLMWFYFKKKIKRSLVAHHKDGNRKNACMDNLEMIDASKHISLHNKGKVLSKEHRQKISQANEKRKGIKLKKRCNIPIVELKEFLSNKWSINKIAKYYGVDWTTIRSRIREQPELLEQNK